MFKTFKRVIKGKFRFQKKELRMQKRAETTALCSKIRGIRQKPKPSKNEQNSQYFEIKLDTQNFLHNIRQSLVYC